MEKRTTTFVKWKQIVDYPEFYISNNGLLKRGNVLQNLKMAENQKGYLFYTFYIQHSSNPNAIPAWKKYIHQLVYEYFGDLTKYKGKVVIDHINENKKDNRIENLQILSPKQNNIKSCLHRGIISKNRFDEISKNESEVDNG